MHHTSSGAWLDRITAMMSPLQGPTEAAVRAAFDRYVAQTEAEWADIAPRFLELKRIGGLTMGVGSAPQAKYLVRVEGASPSPEDDVILELKEIKGTQLCQCVFGDVTDPTRVIEAQARFAMQPQHLLGHVEIEDRAFYVHAWRVHYREVRASDLRAPEELAELAFHVGLQLGRAHPLNPADSEVGRLERDDLEVALDEVEPELLDLSADFARAIEEAFQRFRDARPR